MNHLTLRSREFFPDQDFRLEFIERNPQVPFPLHSHDFSELVIVLGGTGIHFTQGDSYRISGGDVFFIESGFSHGYRNPENLHLYNILFDSYLLEHAFLDIAHMPGYHSIFFIEPKYREGHRFRTRLQLTEDQMKRITDLTSRMRRELKGPSGEFGSRAMALAYFIEAVVTLSRFYGLTGSAESREIHRLSRVFSYMEQNKHRQITIDELVDFSYMSYSTLNRAFQQATGCSPIEYHLQLRIRKACRMLETSPEDITSIAGRCGFEDSNYFSRQFRKTIGMTPRDYRASRSQRKDSL